MIVTQPTHLKTALLVEDDETWGSILSRYLTARGCDVTWMREPSGAISFILDVDPDLIMLDLRFPDQGGPDLLESVERLGPETTSKTAIVTSYPVVAETWADQVRIISKSDLTGIGSWIDELLGHHSTVQAVS